MRMVLIQDGAPAATGGNDAVMDSLKSGPTTGSLFYRRNSLSGRPLRGASPSHHALLGVAAEGDVCSSPSSAFFSSSSLKKRRGNMPRMQPMLTPMAMPCKHNTTSNKKLWCWFGWSS